ncbi:BMP family protein [Blastococcus sp. Marseille-P5729]|uniref:BMP family lipoprotein n=1 Tax=Blastococcus sp. Marseille-P5729 TaxID=2086582 RepID=UPI00131AFFCD|nr:BMP family ABC transporter substrate-binding protein [Blastococcus sp. Marseille-P5729]
MRRPRLFRRGAVAVALAATLVLSACSSDRDSGGSGSENGGGGNGGSGDAPVVAVAFDTGGRGDKSFNDAAAAGLDKAVKEFDLEKATELSGKPDETDADKEARLRQLADNGATAIVTVGFSYKNALETVAPDYPDVKFVLIDNVLEAENVASYVFKDNESAYLVGAIAALTSKTGKIGFVGGVNETLINNFEKGYIAGAQAAKPDIQIDVKYLTEAGDYSGYTDPGKGKVTAEGQYDAGADVIYAAAGLSNNGVFEAAAEKGGQAIGTDSDQYESADPSYKETIIASALKRIDTVVYDFIKNVNDDSFEAGTNSVGLKEEGVDFVINNAEVKSAVESQVTEMKDKIVSGEITVPTA